jgi:shikimate dehydrogenase
VHTRYLEDLPNLGNYDMIVNATSAGRSEADFKLPFRLAEARALAVDLSYGEAAIPFLAWARAAGCEPRIDGLGMLVEQAADSFELWHGHRPETDEVYAELRAHADALHTAD